MRIEEITPERLQELTDDEWLEFEKSDPKTIFAWSEKAHRIVIEESCRRWKKDVEHLIYLDKIRVERFPETGPRQYPDTFEEWWAETGKKQYQETLAQTMAEMEVKPEPGSPN